MKIELIEIDKITPYINNPRKNQNIDKVASSIKEFGFQQPIVVDKKMTIIVGHTRYEASKKLELKKVPVTIADLTPLQAKAYRIADNRVNQDSEWDFPLLNIEFTDLLDNHYELDNLGFDNKELENLITNNSTGLTDEDEVPEKPKKAKTKLGELYQLGSHRLLCGDATKEEDVNKLMNGQKADMILTDPPYNVGYDYNSYNDNKTKEEYRVFCEKWFALLFDVSDSIIITSGKQNLGLWYSIADIKDIGIWIKRNTMSGGRVSHLNLFEPIVFIGNFDRSARVNDIFEYNNRHQKDVAKDHTCPKSAELMVEIVNCYSKKNNVILDVFLGSGSTLIACEKLNRKCYGMELDPIYCDVIIKRWEDYTGQKAKKI